jgi:hypothetical protein
VGNELALGNTISVRVLAYRGVASDVDPNEPEKTIRTGHVGVQPGPDGPIPSFMPYTADEPDSEVISKLRGGASYPGMVENDSTARFIRAQELADSGVYGGATQVYVKDYTVTPQQLEAIKLKIKEYHNASPSDVMRYSWPDYDTKIMPPGCNNCATWVRSLGVSEMPDTGQMGSFMKQFIQSGAKPWPK